MRTRAAWIPVVALIVAVTLAAPAATHLPAAIAQGDGPIDPVTTPEDTDIAPPDRGDGTIEPSEGDEAPIGEPPPPVEQTEPYRVEAECAYAPDAGATQCAFTGVPPAGHAGPVVFLMPAELACAAVIGGDYAWVAPDPATGLNGFQPIGDAGWMTLDLAGVVTPSGTATWWFQSPGGIVPGTGPALACSPAPSAQEPTPSPTPAPTTGTLLVRTHTCEGVPAGRDGYDWFGACDPVAYRVAPAGTQVTPPPESRVEAEALFAEIAPGRYDLQALGFTWCHAVSDNVTADSEVVIEAGARTTVWIFLCDDA
jgi:hypothetical protein